MHTPEIPITADDAYVLAWLRHCEDSSTPDNACAIGEKAWHFEATRRIMCAEFGIPYMVTDQTWGWSHQMNTDLARMPATGLEKCTPDPHGPGQGFHVFGWPSDEDIRANPDEHQAMTILDPQGVEWNVIGLLIRGGEVHEAIAHSETLWKWDRVPREYMDLCNTRTVVLKVQAMLNSVALDTETGGKLPRPDRRRAKREGRPLRECEVRVVRWRRAPHDHHPAGNGDPIERDKHWWVSGHIRNQWYPSEQVHRAIYIAPHIKGEPEAPLYHRPTVNHVAQ